MRHDVKVYTPAIGHDFEKNKSVYLCVWFCSPGRACLAATGARLTAGQLRLCLLL